MNGITGLVVFLASYQVQLIGERRHTKNNEVLVGAVLSFKLL
jgi:hypothetical protein